MEIGIIIFLCGVIYWMWASYRALEQKVADKYNELATVVNETLEKRESTYMELLDKAEFLSSTKERVLSNFEDVVERYCLMVDLNQKFIAKCLEAEVMDSDSFDEISTIINDTTAVASKGAKNGI